MFGRFSSAATKFGIVSAARRRNRFVRVVINESWAAFKRIVGPEWESGDFGHEIMLRERSFSARLAKIPFGRAYLMECFRSRLEPECTCLRDSVWPFLNRLFSIRG